MESVISNLVGCDMEKCFSIEKIYSIFIDEMGNHYSSKGEMHEFWEYIYVDEGQLYVETDIGFFELKRGDFFVHQPYEYHRHYVKDNSAKTYITSFSFEETTSIQLPRKPIHLNEFSRNLIIDSSKVASRIFEDIDDDFVFVKKAQYPTEYDHLLKNMIENILLSAIIQCKNKMHIVKISQLPENSVSYKVIEYLRLHVNQKVTIDELCKLTHMGKTSLSEKFRKETDKSIMESFNMIKILQSIELMKNQDISISEVAHTLNYSSSQHFSKAFKKHTGITPSDYKKNLYGNSGFSLRHL